MLVSLTQLAVQATPFSSRRRGWSFAPLSEGFGYAFNFDDPCGVKLLTPAIYARLADPAGRAAFFNAPTVNDVRILQSLTRNPYAERKPKRLTVWLHVINGCNFA